MTVRRNAALPLPGFRIFTVTDGSQVTLAGLTIANGSIPSFTGTTGGGIFNSGVLTVRDCTVARNSAGVGGGISNTGALTVRNCTVTQNRTGGGPGGGISNSGTLTLDNSTVAENSASNLGIGTCGGGQPFAGGIYNSGMLTVSHSTIAGNTASVNRGCYGLGAGLLNVPGGTAVLQGTLIAANGGFHFDASGEDVYGAFVSRGYNLIGDATGGTGFGAPGDLVGSASNPLDPRLGPLQDNGGPTPTRALLSGSRAIDRGDPADLTSPDQRGSVRPLDGDSDGAARPDIGAFEAPAGTSPFTTPNRRFVSQAYLDLLERPAEEAGLAHWAGLLDRGASRTQVARAIQASTEYLTRVVRQLYSSYLFRDADPDGLSTHVGLLARGAPVDVVRAGLLGSEEYFQRWGGTSDAFLAALYRDVLGREIDAGGRASWGLVLAGGATRYGVALALLRSAEGLTVKVQGLYRHHLGREADPTGLAAFANLLRRRVPEQEAVALLVGSPEYAARL